MEAIDLVVVGGGVVGLACAREAARPGRSVCLIERHPRFGTETSTHNSGVIHAGIYYPAGSLKARLCVEGREALYRFCAPARTSRTGRCGKLIVARSDDDLARLDRLRARGEANGVTDLEIVDARRRQATGAARGGPGRAVVAVDGHRRPRGPRPRAATRRGRARGHPAAGRPRSSRAGATPPASRSGPRPRPSGRARWSTRRGFRADEVSARLGGHRFRIHPCPREYAELLGTARPPIRRPVYPVPAPSGEHLGVHLTPTTWGNVTVGPTVRYQASKDDHEQKPARGPRRSSNPPGRSCRGWSPATSASAARESARSSVPDPPSSPTS